MTKFTKGNAARSKLTHEQVWAIRERYQQGGITQAALARQYGVTAETVGRIVRGETRISVPEPTAPITQEAIAASARALAERMGIEVPPAYQPPPAQPTAAESRTSKYLAELGIEVKE